MTSMEVHTRLFEEIYKKYGMEFSYVDTSKIQDIEKAVKNNSKGFFIETPSNPMMKVTDLKKVSEFAKDRGMLLIVDNTFFQSGFVPIKM